ncbi:hypothetical protein DPMN_011630 [Dreissena polymorpha]|uniref:Uncharacterized protein n=1 Tax=Dreissena polymorpha TaxID=45954 RepID=A0A9D4S2P3_DREPO|nr:hypothetical protein DPMN_011630 [Dreissena polymorpha]
MVVPANNRRATITGFNGERRSSVDRAFFDTSDRSPPSHHDWSSLDALSAPKIRAKCTRMRTFSRPSDR